jgi:hypothetical protein
MVDEQFVIAIPNSLLDFCFPMRLEGIYMWTGANGRESAAHCVGFVRHWAQVCLPQPARFGAGTV